MKSLLIPKQVKDPLPHTIKQNRIYILPTKSGILFCSMLFIMFLVSLNNNNNLGLLFTFLLVSIFITSMIYTHSNLKGLKVLALSSKATFAGKPLEIFCTVFSNTMTRPLINISIPGQNERSVVINESENQQITINVESTTRGKYRPRTILIKTEFPFSFFRAWTYLKTDLECIVYPCPLKSSFQPTVINGNSESEIQANSLKGSEDFDGLKNYQSGDSLKQIYWKGFSRGGGLHSKTYSGGKSEILLFDFDKIKNQDLEKKLSILTYYINQIKNDKFALKLPNITIGPDSGELHKSKCLNELALFGESDV